LAINEIADNRILERDIRPSAFYAGGLLMFLISIKRNSRNRGAISAASEGSINN